MKGLTKLVLAAGASGFGSVAAMYAFGDQKTREKILLGAPVILILLLAGSRAYEQLES